MNIASGMANFHRRQIFTILSGQMPTMKIFFATALLAITFKGVCQDYRVAQKKASSYFASEFYPHRAHIYSLPAAGFLQKIDSLKSPFVQALSLLSTKDSVITERRDIDYFFDRLILDYPYFHHTHTGKKAKLPIAVQQKLDKHRADFNNPELLYNNDVKQYIQGFLRHESSIEVQKAKYRQSDNKRLEAYLLLVARYFTNTRCREYWRRHYISGHLENFGSKNLEKTMSQNNDPALDSLYKESVNSWKDHTIKTYKTVDGYELSIHVFTNDSISSLKPVMVYFSGGSWTEGNPEWSFYNCADYAKRGWVAVSVEYRLADRHETTPFEAVKDARSAIRWLRKNATTYNIDPNRIVVSGNSAGGHLALTAVLADNWNESTDDLSISASPNLVLVNAGVYDIYAENATHWILRDLKNKNLAQKISPFHLARKTNVPILIIHGTADNSVSYSTAKIFTEKMQEYSNSIELVTLEGGPHHIWFDRRFTGKIAQTRKNFLNKHGY